ncbi:MAG: type II toxin-antitoxin system prevent-host-death family antitoxin [Alphaproteobacteria bacterium]|nr:type II toxin-antitoxin system prevent-host-death family antitoxin [Alphaproteobacteria bacterium]MBV9695120.1 type II toxin-antitoxin system prevent-host-death family antitoxin [Alphaproteobacteria bacterium]
MKTVGLRELKNNLSAYVRAARNGETVTVTDRGQAVARLVAPERPSNIDMVLDEMAARGELRRGRKLSAEEKAKLYSWRGPPLLKGITSAELLDELREDTV